MTKANRPAGDAAAGRRAHRAGRLVEAARAYRSYLKANPEDADGWKGLGRVYVSSGRLDDAAYCLWQAVQKQPNNLALLKQLGDVLIGAGDLARAEKVFRQLVREVPGDANAHLSLSAVQWEMGKHVFSRKSLSAGIAQNPVTVQYCLGKSEARILRLRGVQNAHYAVRQDSDHWLRLRGGNFSSHALWDPDRFTTINFLVRDENLSNHDAIPPHDIVINCIADADLEAQSLQTASRYLARHPHMPVINDPARVLETARDNNYQRLKDFSGVRFAKTLRIDWRPDAPLDVLEFMAGEDMDLPVILRRAGTHSAISTEKADSRQAVEDYFKAASAGEFYIIEFVDHPFRKDYFRKMRVFFIDGEIYPVVHHVDRVWNVHGFNRKEVMSKNHWMTELEKSFVDDPADFIGNPSYETLRRLPGLVRLDFFGVDFDVMDDGRLLIFEMNPAMRHSFEHAQEFPYLKVPAQRITDAFQDMILARARLKTTED
ncbi:MAG: tetratricopeptide repeat protein [Rhodospirillales bacterium]|nr:tetratricopeptide repeat protein [Rhodospirillales bacterium]